MIQDSSLISSATGFSHYNVCHTPRTKKLTSNERSMRALRRECNKIRQDRDGGFDRDDDFPDHLSMSSMSSSISGMHSSSSSPRITTPRQGGRTHHDRDKKSTHRLHHRRRATALDPFPCDEEDDDGGDLSSLSSNEEFEDEKDSVSSDDESNSSILKPHDQHFKRSYYAPTMLTKSGYYGGVLLMLFFWVCSGCCLLWNDSSVLIINTTPSQVIMEKKETPISSISEHGISGTTLVTTNASDSFKENKEVNGERSEEKLSVVAEKMKKKKSDKALMVPYEENGVVYYPCRNEKTGNSYFAFVCPNPDFA